MEDDNFDNIKGSVLNFMQQLFAEMEEEMALSHQEKYALLEDAFDNAVDEDELKVAFEQWYQGLMDDIDFGYSVEDLWDQALGSEED